jgi:lipid-binding SYLF domain-containing protein
MGVGVRRAVLRRLGSDGVCKSELVGSYYCLSYIGSHIFLSDITEFVIVLNNDDAVKAFSQGGNVTIGGECFSLVF